MEILGSLGSKMLRDALKMDLRTVVGRFRAWRRCCSTDLALQVYSGCLALAKGLSLTWEILCFSVEETTDFRCSLDSFVVAIDFNF